MDHPLDLQSGPIDGPLMIRPRQFGDDRGRFSETWRSSHFEAALGRSVDFVQDNESVSGEGVLRGLHFQVPDRAQGKLVRVVRGSALDVAVDLRKNSSTYGEWFGVELSAKNQTQLFLPKGFAHGYSVLSERAIVQYKVDVPYNPQSESGIRYNDLDLGIDWQVDNLKLSDKDLKLPFFKDLNP